MVNHIRRAGLSFYAPCLKGGEFKSGNNRLSWSEGLKGKKWMTERRCYGIDACGTITLLVFQDLPEVELKNRLMSKTHGKIYFTLASPPPITNMHFWGFCDYSIDGGEAGVKYTYPAFLYSCSRPFQH